MNDYHDRVEELNERLYDRNIPSNMLQNTYGIHPVSTKYSLMPIIDMYKPADVNIVNRGIYNIKTTFNPGNKQSPWSGYNVNMESNLKNINIPLQKCDKYKWVPSSKSDLYNTRQPFNDNYKQTFKGLFREEKFNDFNPNICNVNQSLWNNNTRVQIREINMNN